MAHFTLKEKGVKFIIRYVVKMLPFFGIRFGSVKPSPMEKYSFQKEVPRKFWEILHAQVRLPSDQTLRRKFTSRIFDLKHKYLCNRLKSDFHKHADPQKCKCKNCKNPMDWYHECQLILNNVVS